jgi:hypothetical protein
LWSESDAGELAQEGINGSVLALGGRYPRPNALDRLCRDTGSGREVEELRMLGEKGIGEAGNLETETAFPAARP